MNYIDIAYKLFEKSEFKDMDSFQFGLDMGLLISQFLFYKNNSCEESKEVLKKSMLENKHSKVFALLLEIDNDNLTLEQALKSIEDTNK